MNFPFARSPMKGLKGKPTSTLEQLTRPTESTKDNRIPINKPRVSKMLPDAFNLPHSPKAGPRPFRPKPYAFQKIKENNFTGKEEIDHLASVDDIRIRKLTIDSEDSKKQEISTSEYVLFDGKVRKKSAKRLPNEEFSPVKVKSQRVKSGDSFSSSQKQKDEAKKNLVFLIKNGKVERKRDKYRKAISPDFERNMNPIRPVREFLKFQKSSENLSLRENLDFAMFSSGSNQKGKYRIEDMITLETFSKYKTDSLEKSQGKVPVITKKVLHAPTFKLLVTKEIPLNSSKISKSLKNYEKKWKSLFCLSTRFVKFIDVFWNSPEGSATLLYEYVPYGSLKDIIEQYVNLPQTALKNLAAEILKASFEFAKMEIDYCFEEDKVLVTTLGTLRYVIGVEDEEIKDKDSFNRQISKIMYFCLSGEIIAKRIFNGNCCPFHDSVNKNPLLWEFKNTILLDFICEAFKSESSFLQEHEFLHKSPKHSLKFNFELRHFSRKNVRWQESDGSDILLDRVISSLRILSPKASNLKTKQLREIGLLADELGMNEEAVREKITNSSSNFPH